MSAPAVSVVIATYDRSNVLRMAVESALAQTMSDLEVVVVGDACTDDTAEVVAAVDDPRARFVSLGRNFGDQSGPNTVGALLARAERIAYLNHDDLWLPDHLERTTEALERTGAPLAFSRLALLNPAPELAVDHPAAVVAGGQRFRADVCGTDREGPWALSRFQPASSWLCRRQLVEELGGWRPAAQLRAEPSADFLYRARRWAHRHGTQVVGIPTLGVLAFPSGVREGSYARRTYAENAAFLARIRADPDAVRKEVEAAAAALDAERLRADPTLAGRRRRHDQLVRAVAATGVNPKELRYRLRGRRKGEFIATLRRRRGLAA